MSESVWDRKFTQEGRVWGDQPSITAKTLKDVLVSRGHIYEVGFGYGRDLIYLARLGHTVSGIDHSSVGLVEAKKLLTEENIDISGLSQGDFTKASEKLTPEKYDALISHRVLHLLTLETDIEKFVENCAIVLKSGGILVISTRDQRDFKPAKMKWTNSERTVAYYKNNKDHIINFWDEARFRNMFSKYFDVLSLTENEEREFSDRSQRSQITTMVALKR